MIISHRHRFVFVHLHKCAGTSVTRALLPFLSADDVVLGCSPEYEARSRISRAQGGLHKHSTAQEIRSEVGESIWSDYVTFTFVRNPWDLVLSKYLWWHKTPGDWDAQAAIRKREVMQMPFSEFAATLGERQNYFERLLSSDGVAAPSLDLDFIGHYERLDVDFGMLCDRLNLAVAKLPLANTSRELRDHDNYVGYYDERAAAHVASVYRREIERFGYRFAE